MDEKPVTESTEKVVLSVKDDYQLGHAEGYRTAIYDISFILSTVCLIAFIFRVVNTHYES